MKILCYFILTLSWLSPAWAVLIENRPYFKNPPGFTECIYIGILDEMRKYNVNAVDSHGNPAVIDDGIFVAVPDGGAFGGYTYWALGFKYIGGMDGGPAFLPANPGEFIEASPGYSYHKAYNYNPFHTKIDGYFRTRGLLGDMPRYSDAWNDAIDVKPLPNGAILPKGTLFFWWVSGGGSFNIPFSMLSPLAFETLTIHTKTIPKNEFEALWFEESETVSVSFRVYEMSPEEYENQWRNTY